VKTLLIKEYKRFFKKPFYKLEHLYTTEPADVWNKKAVFSNMRGLTEEAIISWGNAIEMKDQHQYSILNLMIAKWKSGAITDSDLIKTLEEAESLNDKEDTFLIKGLILLGIGEKEEALKIFKKVFADEVH